MALSPEDQKTVVLTLEGELGAAGATALHNRVIEALHSTGDIHLDCGKAERMDLSTVQILVALRDEMARRGRQISVTGLSSSITAYLKTAGLEGCVASPSTECRENWAE